MNKQTIPKKRILLIILPLIAAILAIVGVLVAKAEVAKAYTVCEKRMLTVDYCRHPWIHEHTMLNIDSNIPFVGQSLVGRTGLVFIFDDGDGEVSCSVYRDLSGWHENEGVWGIQGACLP